MKPVIDLPRRLARVGEPRGAWRNGLRAWRRDRCSDSTPAAPRDRCRRGRAHRRPKSRPLRFVGGGFSVRGRHWCSGDLPARHHRQRRTAALWLLPDHPPGRRTGGRRCRLQGPARRRLRRDRLRPGPAGRGHGYAAEAVVALLALATDRGLSRVVADTTLDNIASQRTLVRAGFRLVGTDDTRPALRGAPQGRTSTRVVRARCLAPLTCARELLRGVDRFGLRGQVAPPL